ncbi:hypothetical protein LEP1GSC170_2967 [Leptospira interrogans serovar Bataviae str. HAI135]|nr:hypothetical protein LEP1GSC170_2967 [Leptospira interrogans serovar Bataviae str. HAI135]
MIGFSAEELEMLEFNFIFLRTKNSVLFFFDWNRLFFRMNFGFLKIRS